MATDYAKMSADLGRFYDFTGKVVLYVGAAGRQLLDPAIPKKLIAIDRNPEGLAELQKQVAERGLRNSAEVKVVDFDKVTTHADAIYFEFCLHEMDDPEQALTHAKSLAPDIVIYDHSADSEWIYYGAEELKVRCSSEAMERFGIRRRQTFQAEQRFANFAELLAKVSPQGPLAIARAQRFAGATDIVIPMSYELNLM